MKLFNTGIVYRIAGLWAFSEAFMGGILHGFKIPFAGLLLSLIAAISMSLIAVNDKEKGTILKITLTVIAVKFMLSPHTPPMAYVAVLMQGFVGELFFLSRRSIKPAAFLLTMFCLLYSAFQHLFVLTIIFGKDFWTALDVFLNGITKTFIKQPQHYSFYLVVFYIGCYFTAGILGGILNWRIITTIQRGEEPAIVNKLKLQFSGELTEVMPQKRKVKGPYKLLFILPIFVLLALILSYTPLLGKTVFSTKAGQILLRGVLVILVWVFLISPLLVKLIQKWVAKYQQYKGGMLQELLSLFPDIKKLVFISWRLAGEAGKLKRLPVFLANTMYLIVYGK
jgi:hypothetical protein